MSGAAGSNVADLTIRTNRPISDPQVADLFSWDASLVGGTVDAYGSSGQARTAAEDGDLLANVFDAAGRPLGFENGDEIRINGSVGGQGIDYDTPLVFSDDPATGTTMGMLVGAIQDAFNLPNTDGTADQNPSVQINPVNSTDGRLPEGAIVVRGQAELAFAIESMSVTATNDNNDATAPNAFTANMASTEIQAARDTTVHSTSIVVYDESGDAHTMTTTFTHSGEPSEWLWEVTMDGGERIIGGSQGRMTFGQDGTPSSFTYDDGSTSFRFNPMNGSNVVDIDLDVGQPGSLRGITQMRSPTTTAAAEQDGYTMGKLQEVSIDEYGEVSGVYSNGITKSIARIYVAEFNNPAGLMKRGDSMFAVSNNSGEAVLHQAGVGSSTKIKPGALEMSNVELASEFTTMITTQRGYQANARVITTSDSMLQELVQLVR
jgi:flagellar hook protein FlgE